MGRLRDVAIDVTPLRESRDFRLLWAGDGITAAGSQLTRVAAAFQVYELTGSTLVVGLLGLVTMFPLFFGSIIGGAIADHHERRHIILLTQLGGLGCAVVLAVNAAAAHPQTWVIFVVFFFSTAAYSLKVPASRSAVQVLVTPEQIPSATALEATLASTAMLLGPVAAGLLIATIGLSWTYMIDVISFALCMALVFLIRPIAVTGTDGVTLKAIGEGLRYLKSRVVLKGSFIADLIAMIFGMPVALFPALVDQRFDGNTRVLGLLYAAPFAGSLVASATSGWARRVPRHGVALCLAIVGWGVAITFFGLVEGLAISLFLLAIAGASDMVSGVFRQSILRMATPPPMMGRMEGVGMAVWTTGPALGDLEAGAVAALTTVDTSIVLGGLACIAGIGILAAAMPGLIAYNAHRDAVVIAPEPAPG
ncbi:MAG TPA: MFS transporter [Acidimicrobiales bacterium]|nr:MFS transporter [Acidimicrobiales bacterium]